MKVYGFRNGVPSPEDNRKIKKSVNRRSANDIYPESNIIFDCSDSLVSPESRLLETSNLPKDRIGPVKNRLADPGGTDSADNADIGDSGESARKLPDNTCRLNIISGAVSGPGGVSSESRIAAVRRKIADGYYDSPEFIEKLADTLINKLYLAAEND